MRGTLFTRDGTEGYIGGHSALDRYLGDTFNWRETNLVSRLRVTVTFKYSHKETNEQKQFNLQPR